MKTHLTDVVVSRLRPGMYYDETLPAFGIRVGKNRKTWIVMRGVERIRTRIGHYPALSLKDAREAARKLLTEAPTPKSKTLGEAYTLFKGAIADKKPRTQKDYKRLIEKYLLKLKTNKLGELTYEQIMEAMPEAPSERSHALAVWPVPGFVDTRLS